MFSKETTTPELVEEFNQALGEARRDRSYHRIVRQYVFPVLLGITVERPWFLAIDIVGTIAFAISGLLLAHKEKYSIFGAFVLAALPAFGGGMLRDLLVGREPIGVMRTSTYLLVVIATVTIGYFFTRGYEFMMEKQPHFFRRFVLLKYVVDFFDTLGLAAFTIIGVVIAVEAQIEPLWLWGPLLAVLTGAGGGILRDVLRSDPNIASLKTNFYPEVGLIWGFFLSLFLLWQTQRLNPSEIFNGVIITLIGALLTRLAVLRWNIKSWVY